MGIISLIEKYFDEKKTEIYDPKKIIWKDYYDERGYKKKSSFTSKRSFYLTTKLGLTIGNGWIFLSKGYPECPNSNEVMLKTLLHELLHYDTRFGGPLVICSDEDSIRFDRAMIQGDEARYLPTEHVMINDSGKYRNCAFDTGTKEHKEMEKAIEEQVEIIYACQPMLVKYLEHRLGLANHSEIRFFMQRRQKQLFYCYEYNPFTETLTRTL